MVPYATTYIGKIWCLLSLFHSYMYYTIGFFFYLVTMSTKLGAPFLASFSRTHMAALRTPVSLLSICGTISGERKSSVFRLSGFARTADWLTLGSVTPQVPDFLLHTITHCRRWKHSTFLEPLYSKSISTASSSSIMLLLQLTKGCGFYCSSCHCTQRSRSRLELLRTSKLT